MERTIYAPVAKRRALGGLERLRTEAAEARARRAIAELAADAASIRLHGGGQASLDAFAARAERALEAECLVAALPPGAVGLRNEVTDLVQALALASHVLVGVEVNVPEVLVPARSAIWIRLIVTELLYGLSTAAYREDAVDVTLSAVPTAGLLSMTVRCTRLQAAAEPSERGMDALVRASRIAAALSGSVSVGRGAGSAWAALELPMAALGRVGR